MTKTIETDKDFIEHLTENKFDGALGMKVQSHLVAKGLEIDRANYSPEDSFAELQNGVEQGFKWLGIDPEDPSTKDTPRRFAAMFVGELTRGLNYSFFPKCTATPNGDLVQQNYTHEGKFGNESGSREVNVGGYNQMVLVRDIEIMSLCEHHLQTIDGKCHIAYVPKTSVLGLSKFARVADFFARRPQIQERMTEQIYEALSFILETDDIAVVVDATHFCMRARGAMQSQATTQTNKMGGRFMTHPSLRQEFLDAIR